MWTSVCGLIRTYICKKPYHVPHTIKLSLSKLHNYVHVNTKTYHKQQKWRWRQSVAPSSRVWQLGPRASPKDCEHRSGSIQSPSFERNLGSHWQPISPLGVGRGCHAQNHHDCPGLPWHCEATVMCVCVWVWVWVWVCVCECVCVCGAWIMWTITIGKWLLNSAKKG